MFRSTTDLIFDMIDAGHDFGIPGHPDDWPEVEHLKADKLIERSIQAELSYGRKRSNERHNQTD